MTKRIYIFVTNSVYGLGGAQLLTLRKARYLRDKGWDVLIIYKRIIGEYWLKDEFGAFSTLYIPEFSSHYNFVNKEKLSKIKGQIDFFLDGIDYKSSFIESNDIICAVWAEYLSSVYGIKHALYMLSEENMKRIYYYPYKSYYDFKLHNNELWGCNSRGLEVSFGKNLPQYSHNYINVAFDEKEIPVYSSPAIPNVNLKPGTIVISTLTRLEKPYLTPLIDNIAQMCKSRKDVNILFIIAGGSVDRNEEYRIRRKAEECNKIIENIQIIITGYIKPGRDFFSQTDMFVGMGTAAISALSQGCIVLPINPLTNKTPGVFGVETYNFAYSESKEEYSITEKILQLSLFPISKRKELSKNSIEYFQNHYSLDSTNAVFEKLYTRMRDHRAYSFKYAALYKPIDYLVEITRRLRNILRGGKEKKWVV